jgi:hypothetical protein
VTHVIPENLLTVHIQAQLELLPHLPGDVVAVLDLPGRLGDEQAGRAPVGDVDGEDAPDRAVTVVL